MHPCTRLSCAYELLSHASPRSQQYSSSPSSTSDRYRIHAAWPRIMSPFDDSAPYFVLVQGIEGGASKGEHRRSSRRRRRRRIFDPYYVDIVCFLQILVDVTVSCPVASMRARGHEAMSGFLAAVGEASRFRVLKRLIDRCPWPNATGLLLDMFRKEIDRAMRRCPCRYGDERSLPTTEGQTSGNDDECSKSTKNSASIVKDKEHSITEGRRAELQGSSFAHPTGNTTADADGNACAGERETGRVKSPFASAAAGGVVCEQLQKACRGGPPASLLMDMDSRTGALTLAWYAHALNRAESVGGNGLGDGRLKLHELEKLRKNRLLVEVMCFKVGLSPF